MVGLRGEILNSPGLVNDGPVEFYNCPIVQRAFIGLAHSFDHFALARMIAKRCARLLLRLANLQSDASALVEQAQ